MPYNDYNELQKFHGVCRTIIEHSDAKALNYAVNYAKAGLGMTNANACRVQSMYIKSNMTHWRGDIAKGCRQVLTELIKYWE